MADHGFIHGNPGSVRGLVAPTLETMENYVIHEARVNATTPYQPITLCGITKDEWDTRSERSRDTWRHSDPKFTTCPECLAARDASAVVTDVPSKRKKT